MKDEGSAAIVARFPDGWDQSPFWAHYRRVKRQATGTEELLSVYREYGVIRKSDRDDNFNRPSEDLTAYQVVIPGDLVINKMKAWQGSVAISSLKGIVSPAYFVFEPLSDVDPSYAHYLLRSDVYVEAYRAASKGIRPNQWDLDPELLRVFPVVVPDHATQRSLAEFLDRETAEIDAFIADQEQLIELLTERRAATISHAVTKGLDPSVPMKDSGIEWIGDIPAHWEVSKVRAAVTDINLRNDPIRSENYLSLMANIGVMLYEEKGDVGNKAPEDFSRCKLVQTGDLVINSMNYGIGSFGVSPHDGICSPVYIVLRPLQESVVAYVERIFECRPFQRLAQSFGNGILEHRRSINWGILKGMEVPKPPINEQHAIAAYLSAEVAQIDATIADAREAIALSRERRAALISAAVTGKIDVRGAE